MSETRITSNFGVYLADHRERKGYTVRELAERVNPQNAAITRINLMYIEVGKQHPWDDLLKCLIEVLELDEYEAYWLVGRLPKDVTDLLVEAGPDEWQRLKEKYGS